MSEWTRTAHGDYRHDPTGVTIEKTTNPHAIRTWFVSLTTGDANTARRAFLAGCIGGFFRLRDAKTAVEQNAN